MLNGHARRESMVMDMDVLAESAPTSRVPSPQPISEPPTAFTNGEAIPEEAEGPPKTEEAPKKVGNLMKELKQDVQQGAMEFDMDSFF